jgi:hypothetical protein
MKINSYNTAGNPAYTNATRKEWQSRKAFLLDIIAKPVTTKAGERLQRLAVAELEATKKARAAARRAKKATKKARREASIEAVRAAQEARRVAKEAQEARHLVAKAAKAQARNIMKAAKAEAIKAALQRQQAKKAEAAKAEQAQAIAVVNNPVDVLSAGAKLRYLRKQEARAQANFDALKKRLEDALEAEPIVVWLVDYCGERRATAYLMVESGGLKPGSPDELRALAIRANRTLMKLRERVAKAEAVLKAVKAEGGVLGALADVQLRAPREEEAAKERKAPKRAYTVLSVKPDAIFPLPEELKALHDAKTTAQKLDALKAMLAASEKLDIGKPAIVWEKDAKVDPRSESDMADVLAVAYGRKTDKVLGIEHCTWSLIEAACPSWMWRSIPGAEDMMEAIARKILDKLTISGIVLKRHNGKLVESTAYTVAGANSSQLKEGKATGINGAYYKQALHMLTYGMLEKANTSGQDLLKILALAQTPSTPITWRDEHGTIHYVPIENVIVVPKLMGRITLDKTIEVGGDGWAEFPVKIGMKATKVKLHVTWHPEGQTLEWELFDGEAVSCIPGFAGGQLRGGPYKGFDVNVKDISSLKEHLAKLYPELGIDPTKPLMFTDIDGRQREFGVGSVLVTESCWKAKSLGTPAEIEAAIKAIREEPGCDGELPRHFGVLRVAIEAHEDDKRRKTSGQMLQQMWGVTRKDFLELTAPTSKKLARERHAAGILPKMAGAGKGTPTATERLLRIIPELLAVDQFADLAEQQFMDDAAEAGQGKHELPMEYRKAIADPVAFVASCLAGKADDMERILNIGEVVMGKKRQDKGFDIRYPASDFTVTPVQEVWHEAFDAFELTGIIAIHPEDPAIVVHDMDFDGDGLNEGNGEREVAMVEKTNKILDHLNLWPTTFEHGGNPPKRPYDWEFIRQGIVDSMLNGEKFNLVGRMAKGASAAHSYGYAAWANYTRAMASVKAGDEGMSSYATYWRGQAVFWGVAAKVLSTASILCIDWAKQGVPENGPGRVIFDDAMKLLELIRKHPWWRAFKDSDRSTTFVELLKPTEEQGIYGPYMDYRYLKPGMADGVLDQMAGTCLANAGFVIASDGQILSGYDFDRSGLTFDKASLAKLGWEPVPQAGTCRVTRQFELSPDKYDNPRDKEIARRIMASCNPTAATGEKNKLSWKDMLEFFFRNAMNLERRIARAMREEKAEATSELQSDKQLFLKAIRTILLTCEFDKWGDSSTPEGRKAKVECLLNYAISLAFEIGYKNSVGDPKTDAPRVIRWKKARFAKFIFDVFGVDILYRVEQTLPEVLRTVTNEERKLLSLGALTHAVAYAGNCREETFSVQVPDDWYLEYIAELDRMMA